MRIIVLQLLFPCYVHFNDAFSTSQTDKIWKPSELYMSVTTPTIQRESSRLDKARRILSELELDYYEDDTINIENKENSQVEKEKTDATTATATTTVPDSFWRNSHLQDSGTDQKYVTRWKRGVKVAEPLVQYDAIATEKRLFRQPAKWLIRNVQIAFPLSLWALNLISDYISGNEKKYRRQRAKQLLSTISTLGPAIIKGGQALGSRPDLMAKEYLEELQELQDNVPCYENEKAFQIVEEELGREFSSVFELVEDEPIAAASIGQVYKARLLSNNSTVAIKIQRPNCESIIALDLYILRWWAGIANILTSLFDRDIDVQSIIDDFGVLIYRELDYVAEAANAQRFGELYDVRFGSEVFVPKVYSDLTTSKVLVMEWVDGFRLTDANDLAINDLNKQKLLKTLIQCSLVQILENGFFHADPHAGNLLATQDGRLCYLDFGMMSYAAANQRNGFLLAVVHIINRDWNQLVRLYVKLGFIPENTDLEPIEIALENALPDVLNADVSELNFKNVINKLGDVMFTYPFSLPPFYIGIIRCLGVLEGLAIQVDPQTRVLSEAYPYIASRVLTDSQEDLKEALRRLAFTNDGKHVRWDRLYDLLEEANGTSGYDVASALDQLSAYILSNDGEYIVRELTDQIVEAADTLGAETGSYILQASSAFSVNDEVEFVKAFRSLSAVINRLSNSSENAENDFLPELSPSLKRFLKIVSVLGIDDDPARYLPLVRKLSQEPRIQRAASDIVARLGERLLSRGLRAAFGLPAPDFNEERSAVPS